MAQALVASLSPRRPRMKSRSIHVEFVWDKVALGYVSPVTVIPPMLHTANSSINDFV
jgi:hypothetical protein